MTRTILLALTLVGCATTPVHAPDPPRLRCINYGAVEGTAWFIYACTFTGQPDALPSPDDIAGVAAQGES